jgi:hypothetical protein
LNSREYEQEYFLALLALSLTTIFCTLQPRGQESSTPDVNAMVNATLTAMAFATDQPILIVPAPIPTVPVTGSISGHLSYPSDFLPPMRVVFQFLPLRTRKIP